MTFLRRILLAIPVLLLGAAAVTLLAPGGLGDPGRQLVTAGPSAEAYRDVVGTAADLPGWLHGLGEYGALGGVLLLVGLLCGVGWTGWRRRSSAPGAAPLLGPLLVAVGTMLAYLTSEAVKLVVDQERPCRAFDVVTWLPCPPDGDWSFPSNHSTIVGAMAAGLVLLAPRLGFVAVPVAVVVATLRVVAGVHYPHDVLAGLLLGASVTIALLVASGVAGIGPRTGARLRAGLSGDGVAAPRSR